MRNFRMLIAIGIVLVLLFGGCQKQKDEFTPTAGKKPEITIFSWWTAGGEADGLQALIVQYESEDYAKVVNAAVAGGAGSNAKAVLKTRMLSGNPPSTFQVHGGAELMRTWVKPGLMTDISFLYKEKGWLDVFPKQLIDMLSDENGIYAVPANIHRGNMLWYNKKIFDDNGIAPPTDFDSWISTCNSLKKIGITPIAVGSRNKWPVLHLFENLLLGAGGAEFYRGLFDGSVSWKDPRVKTAVERLGKLFDFVNDNHSVLTWDQAAEEVRQGKAAMTVMGDWANGYFTSRKAQPGVDYDAMPVPGTQGNFDVITDTFGMPVNAPEASHVVGFLKVVGSKKGQIAFNKKKGSLPARTDVDPGLFDPITQRSIKDFRQDALAPSCAHGSAAPEQFVTAVNDELSVFIEKRDVDALMNALDYNAMDAQLKTKPTVQEKETKPIEIKEKIPEKAGD